MAEAAQATPAIHNPMLLLAERCYDLAAVLSLCADRLAEVHGHMKVGDVGEHELWECLRSVRHCQRFADGLGGEVEDFRHG